MGIKSERIMIKPYYEDNGVVIYYGNCLEILPEIQGVSAVVTDPPYELGFMGKSWDSRGVSFNKDTWQVIRNSCKSGAPLLSFGGTRTFHRIACAIEDGGWEYRDTIMWVYGSGFPKSLDISKAIDKQAGIEREVIGKVVGMGKQNPEWNGTAKGRAENSFKPEYDLTKPTSKEAQLWDGYGTALKPAYEPIVVCMNPIEGTFANNAIKYGVAGLNIDECRVGDTRPPSTGDANKFVKFKEQDGCPRSPSNNPDLDTNKGRFPANLIHDGSQMVLDLFPDGGAHGGQGVFKQQVWFNGDKTTQNIAKSNGSAARFFYCAKSSKSERNKGCEDIEQDHGYRANGFSDSISDAKLPRGNTHPTVKPLALMEYLCKLVKMPEYNLILDPFVGSGTTLLACIRLGIPCVGIDSDEKACEIAAKRCNQAITELDVK
jgi:DNA modification methylase